MHVAFNGWFWDKPNTGSGQYLYYLLHNLRRVAPDLQMTLVLPSHIKDAKDLPANVTPVYTHGMGGNIGKVWFEQMTFPQAAAKCDIAHVPYWGSPLSSPVKLVTSVLDAIPAVIPEYAGGFLPRLYTSLVTASARGSSHVLTLSEASKNDIIKYLEIPAERITVTHLAPDEAYHPRLGAERDAEVRKKYNLPNDFVLCLSGFDKRKNIGQLLEAYTYVMKAEDTNYPLVLAGREPEWAEPMFPNMRQRVEELDLAHVVEWIGFVDEADKPSLYRMAKVVVFPSLYEGFGLPVIEAMASGTPVVALNASSIPEIAGDGAYLVEPGDARAMGGAIIALLGQEPLRDSLVNAGLAQATRFSWRKTAKETLAVYEQVASQ